MIDGILNKHSLAVHSSADLSLLERKITNALLFNAVNSTQDKEEHQIRVSHLLKIIGIKTRNYTQIYFAIRSIATTLIEWGILKTDSFKGDLTGITFLEMYRIHNGLITYRLPKELKALLYHPNQYAKIRLSSIAAMTSSYGVALYENCASYSGWGDTGWISINHFRKLMGVADKYDKYRDFKKRVIQTAVLDVNKHTEFSLDLLEKKEGRNTAKIKFLITKKKDENSTKTEKPITDKLIEELNTLGIAKDKINQWLSKHTLDDLMARVEHINLNAQIKNKVGFLIASVENDYKINDRKIQIPFDLPDEKEKYKCLKHKLLSEWFEKLSKEHWKTLCDTLIGYVENINPIVYQEFKERLHNKSYLDYYNTTEDLYYFIEQLIQNQYPKVENLVPPKLIPWREYVGQKCPSK